MAPLAARNDLSPTGPVSPASSAARPARRCRIHLSAGGTRFSEEITGLLRNRLKIVSAIALFPLLALFVRDLVVSDELPPGSGLVLALQAVVIAGTAVLAALLWWRPCLTRRALRGMELGLF